MSQFSHHEPCPNCGSKDNMGVWDDGHKYCFGCGYGIRGYRGMAISDLRQHLQQKERHKSASSITLPRDYTHIIPEEPLKWLRKYGITDKDVAVNHIGWSENACSLIFCCFDVSGNLCLRQDRYFGPDNRARFLTYGFPEVVFHFCGNGSSEYVVLCEDYISAIILGRARLACPLWGSQISIDRIRVLSDRFSKLVIWLDKDKAAYALRAKIRAEPFFDEVQCVITERDPKCYSDNEIRLLLRDRRAILNSGTGTTV